MSEAYKFPGPYKAQAQEGWNAAPGTTCPFKDSELGARCAWLAGHYERYGLAAWARAR